MPTTDLPTSDPSAACELCDEREVAFWCNDCQQWMCAHCKKTHLKARANEHHNVTAVVDNQGEIKRQLDVIRQTTKQALDAKTCRVQQLEQYLEMLETKRTGFMKNWTTYERT